MGRRRTRQPHAAKHVCAALAAGPGPGDAARAKLMLQIMMGNMVGALAEMMALTRAAGLDEGQAHSLTPHSTSVRDRVTTRSFHHARHHSIR